MFYLLKKNIFLISLLILFGIILAGINQKWSFPDNHWTVEKGTKIKLPDQGITQKFQADYDGLSQIRILFGNSRVSHGGTLELKISSTDCSHLLRTSKLKLHSLKSKDTIDFAFSRINHSQGKIYCLNLHFYPKPKSKHAYLFIIKNSMPQNKYLAIGNQVIVNQSLAMRPAYLNYYLWQNIQELNQRISQYKPWFLKHYFLNFIGFGFILLSFLLVFILITL